MPSARSVRRVDARGNGNFPHSRQEFYWLPAPIGPA